MRLIAGCILIVICAAPLLEASQSPVATVEAPTGGVFDPVAGQFDPGRFRMRETLKLSGPRLESPSVSYSELLRARGAAQFEVFPARGGGTKSIALAVLASAILPGAGELYVWSGTRRLSHLLRAPVLMALDAYLWYGYRDNYTRGKDIKSRYEAFCDAHWSEERFLLQHPFCQGIGGCDDWQQYNRDARDDYYFFIYIPKELDREEYYENAGKYDAFAFGWDDWDGGYDDLWTPNRTKYWQMRFDSDHYLLRGDQYVMLLIVNRVVSMLDAGWLAYRASHGAYDDVGWSLDLRPGLVAPTVGVSYRF